MGIEGIKAFRIVVKTPEQFISTRNFYRDLLGKTERIAFGEATSIQQAAFFDVGGIDLIVTREQEATPEAAVSQGPAWICFKTSEPDTCLTAARARGTKLPNDVVDTSFGTKGFFANDPMGLPLYIGTPWES